MTDDPNRPTADPPADDDTDDATADPEVIDAQGLVARLVGAGILREDEEVDDLRLTDGFREDWWERIDGVRDDERARREMARFAEVDPETVSLETDAGRFVVYHKEAELGEWPSRAAFVADLSLEPTMESWLPLWERIDPVSRGKLLARIRAFLETCPSCMGLLEVEEQTDAETGRDEVSVACEDCGQVMVSGEL